MPVKGTTCGLRPDLDKMGADTGFDFSMAKALLAAEKSDETASQQEATSTQENAKQTNTSQTTIDDQ